MLFLMLLVTLGILVVVLVGTAAGEALGKWFDSKEGK